MARRAKLGLPKAVTYSVGVFTVGTDLKAIIELYGEDRTISLVKALSTEIRSLRSKKALALRSNAVVTTQQARLVDKSTLNISETVKREMRRIDAMKRANRSKKAA